MDPELILSVAALAAFTAGVLYVRREGKPSLLWWWLSWGALIASALCREFDLHVGPFDVHLFAAALFPFLILGGAIRLGGQIVPRWIPALAMVSGLVRAGAADFGFENTPHWMPILVDSPVLALAARWAYLARGTSPSRSRRLLPFSIALVIVPRVVDAISDGLGSISTPFALWLAGTFPLACLQITDALSTTRRQMTDNLTRFRAISESAYDLILETDANGTVLYASSSFSDVLGLDPESLVGRNALSLVHPEDLSDAWERAEPDSSRVYPAFRMRHRDGAWRWFESTARGYRTSGGEHRLAFVTRDITERLELEDKISETQKLESLGLLAGGIAHDFNNLLVPILGNASLAVEEAPPDSALREILVDVEDGAYKAAELTQQLLAYAGRRHRDIASVDVSRLTEEVLRLVSGALGAEVCVTPKLAVDLPAVHGDASQLQQVILNLLTNATEAIGDAPGTIVVRTDVIAADTDYLTRAELIGTLSEGSYVTLDVIDDGCGMNEATRSRIFDPFFTTKASGRGLGLAVLSGIVRSHGGAIQITSVPDVGTTMRVLLPTAVSAAQPRERAAPAPRPAVGHGRVLVVDDDPAVRTFARRVLERGGYEVTVAADGREAVRRVEADDGELVAVIMDVRMPLLSGDAAYLQIRRRRRDLAFVFSSGFAAEDLGGRLPNDSRVGFVEKPYRPRDLLVALARVIDAD